MLLAMAGKFETQYQQEILWVDHLSSLNFNLSNRCTYIFLEKFYGRYPDLITKYQRSVKDIMADSVPD